MKRIIILKKAKQHVAIKWFPMWAIHGNATWSRPNTRPKPFFFFFKHHVNMSDLHVNTHGEQIWWMWGGDTQNICDEDVYTVADYIRFCGSEPATWSSGVDQTVEWHGGVSPLGVLLMVCGLERKNETTWVLISLVEHWYPDRWGRGVNSG